MKKYAILDIVTGQYTYYDAEQDIVTIVAKQMLEVHLTLAHNTLWSIVEFNEDGSQTWRNSIGDEVPDPETVKARLEAEMLAFMELVNESMTSSTSTTTIVE